MSRLAPWVLALAIPCVISDALACGVCIEDKVALVYDHAVASKAAARGHVVVFAEAAGAKDAPAVATAARAAAKRISGIEASSVRAAGAPVSISFALDPAVRTPAEALAALERAAGRGLRLRLLKVLP